MTRFINEKTLPLVSVGVPVRNGGQCLREALDQILSQSYTHLEVIISNNNSIDETEEICRHYQQLDSRVILFNQKYTLTVLENFKYVLNKASGEYFLWAACDDRRDANYIEALMDELVKNGNSGLAFPTLKIISDYSGKSQLPEGKFDISLKASDGFWRNIYFRHFIRSGYFPVYGLIKRSLLVDYKWPDIEIAPDRPLLFYLSRRGDFVQTDKTCFYSFKPLIKKTVQRRARDNYASNVKPFAYSRLNYICARMACYAEELEGRHRSLWLTFLMFQLAEIRNKWIRLLRRLSRKFFGNRNEE